MKFSSSSLLFKCSFITITLTASILYCDSDDADPQLVEKIIKLINCRYPLPSQVKVLDTLNKLTQSFPYWRINIPISVSTKVNLRPVPRTVKAFRSLNSVDRQTSQFSLHFVSVSKLAVEDIEAFLQIQRDYESPQRDNFLLLGEKSATSEIISSAVAKDFKYIYAVSGEADTFDGCDSPFMNLRGRVITALAGMVPTYFQVDSQGLVSGGSHYLAFTAIARAYNFTATVKTQRVGTGVLKNGTWNGMTGAVFYRKFDVGLLQSATYGRSGIIDFVFVQFSTVLFTTKCAGREVLSGSILAPFKTQVWMALAVSFVAVSVATYLILWHYGNARDSIVFTVFIPFQIALDQGFDIQIPRGLKTLSAIWMFSMVTINSLYRSDLIKYFSFPRYEVIPKNLEQLDQMSNFTVIFNYNGGTAYNYFEGANDGVPKRIRDRFARLESNMEKCVVASALNQQTVCISWDLNVRPIVGKNLTLPGSFEPCVVFSDPVLTFASGITLTRNSVYTDAFTRAVGRVRDSGLIERWNEGVVYNFSVVGKYWYRENQGEMYHRVLDVWKAHHEQSSFLKLKNITTAFKLLAVGVFAAAIVSAIEISRRKKDVRVTLTTEQEGISTRICYIQRAACRHIFKTMATVVMGLSKFKIHNSVY